MTWRRRQPGIVPGESEARIAVGGRYGAVAAVVMALVLLSAPSAAGAPSRGPIVGGDIHSLVVDPVNPQRVFVGGHLGVGVSTDGGRSWRAVRSLTRADAMGWGFAGPEAWVSGHPGLNHSADGRRFERVNAGLPNTDVHAFGAGATLLIGASPAVGIFVSLDRGRTWQARNQQLGTGFFGRIIVDPADEQHLIAADATAGPVESRDGGTTWRRLGGLDSAGWISAAADLGVLVASGPRGVVRSRDGGATWEAVGLPRGAFIVELNPTNPDQLFAAGLVGQRARVRVSQDGGATWANP